MSHASVSQRSLRAAQSGSEKLQVVAMQVNLPVPPTQVGGTRKKRLF